MARTKNKATVYTLSEELGVSPGTVSKALRNSPEISVGTRKRIRDRAATYGFQPRPVVTNTTNICALIQTRPNDRSLFSGDYTDPVLNGIWQYVQEHDLEMSIFGNPPQVLNDSDLVRILYRRNVNGVVVINANDESSFLQRFDEQDLPYVHIQSGRSVAARWQLPVDNFGAVRNAVQHLIALGHRRIGLCNSISHMGVGTDREAGYKTALLEANIAESCILERAVDQTDYEFGRDAFEQVIAGRAPRITAILATSVPTAIGVMHTTYEHGLTIPRDLSIIACDNPPETQYLNPSLTVIDFPNEKLGYAAAQWVHQRIAKTAPEKFPKGPWHRCELIVRESIGPAEG